MDFLWQVASFIIVVLVLVTVHEFGHFSVARLLNIKVTKFSIGFGPAIIRWLDKSGTEYAIAWFPLGGYVRLLDESDPGEISAEDLPRAFNRQALWKRFSVVLAGPGINLVFAIFAFWLTFVIGVPELKPVIGHIPPQSIAAKAGMQADHEIVAIDGRKTKTWQNVLFGVFYRLGEKGQMQIQTKKFNSEEQPKSYSLNLSTWKVGGLNPRPMQSLGIYPFRLKIPPIIEKVLPNGAAKKAGLKPGDKIVAMNSVPVKDWVELIIDVRKYPNKEVKFTVLRGGKRIEKSVMVGSKRIRTGKLVGYLGVQAKPVALPKDMMFTIKYPPHKAVFPAIAETWSFFKFNFVILGKMVIGRVSLQSLGGPITIFRTANQAFLRGVVVYINFLALISIMLAFVNILPIPGLDGGHLLYFVIEAIRGKPLSVAAQVFTIRIGIIILIVLVFQATINDLLRLLS